MATGEKGNKAPQQAEDAQGPAEKAGTEANPVGGLNAPEGADGATLEALAQAKTRARGAGLEVNEEFLADTLEKAQELGYFGYSPTGAGENDHPAIRSGRLGSLGEFEEGV